MTHRIVITGGPASGKTVSLERLKKVPELAGFLFFEELARKLLTENSEYRTNSAAFHREIYCRQEDREREAGDRSFVTDRGTIDAFVFHPKTALEVNTTIDQEYKRYTAVLFLGSAASFHPDLHRRDDIRHESPAEALKIEEALKKVWANHPALTPVPAQLAFEQKYDLVRRSILELIKSTG